MNQGGSSNKANSYGTNPAVEFVGGNLKCGFNNYSCDGIHGKLLERLGRK